jgi:hypothetical protein
LREPGASKPQGREKQAAYSTYVLNKTADLISATRRFLVSKTGNVAGDERRAWCSLSWLLEFMQQWARRS